MLKLPVRISQLVELTEIEVLHREHPFHQNFDRKLLQLLWVAPFNHSVTTNMSSERIMHCSCGSWQEASTRCAYRLRLCVRATISSYEMPIL